MGKLRDGLEAVRNIFRDKKAVFEEGKKEGIKAEKKARRGRVFNRALGAGVLAGGMYLGKKGYDKLKDWDVKRRQKDDEELG